MVEIHTSELQLIYLMLPILTISKGHHPVWNSVSVIGRLVEEQMLELELDPLKIPEVECAVSLIRITTMLIATHLVQRVQLRVENAR